MQRDRAGGSFGSVFGNLSTVVAHCRGGVESSGREPGECSTPTEAQNAYFGDAQNLGGVLDRCRHIEQSVVHADPRRSFPASGGIRGIVLEFEVRLNAVEQGRSNRQESLSGIVIRDGTDVAIYAEDFLDHNYRGMRGAFGCGDIRSELVPITGLQFDL